MGIKRLLFKTSLPVARGIGLTACIFIAMSVVSGCETRTTIQGRNVSAIIDLNNRLPRSLHDAWAKIYLPMGADMSCPVSGRGKPDVSGLDGWSVRSEGNGNRYLYVPLHDIKPGYAAQLRIKTIVAKAADKKGVQENVDSIAEIERGLAKIIDTDGPELDSARQVLEQAREENLDRVVFLVVRPGEHDVMRESDLGLWLRTKSPEGATSWFSLHDGKRIEDPCAWVVLRQFDDAAELDAQSLPKLWVTALGIHAAAR